MTGKPSLVLPGTIDWSLLHRQKQWLVCQADTSSEAHGLLELLDCMQDAAVDQAGIPEEVVFPSLDQDNGGLADDYHIVST